MSTVKTVRRQDPARTLSGLCQDSVRTLSGLCQDCQDRCGRSTNQVSGCHKLARVVCALASAELAGLFPGLSPTGLRLTLPFLFYRLAALALKTSSLGLRPISPVYIIHNA